MVGFLSLTSSKGKPHFTVGITIVALACAFLCQWSVQDAKTFYRPKSPQSKLPLKPKSNEHVSRPFPGGAISLLSSNSFSYETTPPLPFAADPTAPGIRLPSGRPKQGACRQRWHHS